MLKKCQEESASEVYHLQLHSNPVNVLLQISEIYKFDLSHHFKNSTRFSPTCVIHDGDLADFVHKSTFLIERTLNQLKK